MDFPLTTRVCAVQPRVCGERSASVLAVCDENGSAPRVRGTVQIDAVIGLVDRFSPACAGNGGRADLWWAVALVQPRVCGERFQSSQARPQTGGSAPRVRGTDLAALMVVSGARFSPACAGNGQSPVRLLRVRPVQPRVCGERTVAGVLPRSMDGSAPRVRGTGPPVRRRRQRRRFSPACAGNGPTDARYRENRAVQPRVCGERRIVRTSPVRAVGSAPRVRGTARTTPARAGQHRFSPACAGNGRHTPKYAEYVAVQPRVCGERATSTRAAHRNGGSAPRVRGTDLTGIFCIDYPRFSPACAGNGLNGSLMPAGRPVQPRVCGERKSPGSLANLRPGSAPRVRGTVKQYLSEVEKRRFSPACAGNGCPTTGTTAPSPVQPRVCGERICTDDGCMGKYGSAPRVRGTAAQCLAVDLAGRFSPACAGNGCPHPQGASALPVQPRVCGERSPITSLR